MGSESKVALITGGSSGIGYETALEFSRLNYRVAVTGRNQERLEKVFEEMVMVSPSKRRENFLIIRADFEKDDEIENVVAKTVVEFGQLDALINNAGFAGKKREIMAPDFFQDFQRILQVNLLAATRISQLAVPHLIKTKGVIINVSSIADRLGMPDVSYSVSKAGLSMLTKTLANALDGEGVRVVTVSPGPIRTNIAENLELNMEDLAPMSSLNRIGEAKEVADLIAFLCSDKASYIHACTVDIDGGVSSKFGIMNKVQSKQQ